MDEVSLTKLKADEALRNLGFVRPRRGRALPALTFEDLEVVMRTGWALGWEARARFSGPA